MSIYKQSHICGEIESELTPELYRRWGLALGMRLPPKSKFVVGGDVRSSTTEYLAALTEGLCRSGLNVVALGVLPTPMIYHAKHRLHADGCAIVTASHLPASSNGLKWMIGARPPTPQDVEALRRGAENPPQDNRPATTPRPLDISFDYVANLQETWIEAMGAQRHVVLDLMHGGWSGKARRYLHAIFPQCLFTTIRDHAEGNFSEHPPNCTRHGLLHELSEAVYRERANLGVAFDGNGGRLTLVDDQGVVLNPEETTWILLDTFDSVQWKSRPFVYDLKFSDRLPQRAKALGAEPLVERSGYAPIRDRMVASGALFGAETNGHYFYRTLEGSDDGLYTACRVIAFLAQSGKTLSDLRRQCPPVYITPDLRLPMLPEDQPAFLDHLRSAWAAFPQRTLDGLRIDTPAGWMLVRPSANEAAITCRLESLDWAALNDLVDRFCKTLPEQGEELRQQYAAAMGAAGEQPPN